MRSPGDGRAIDLPLALRLAEAVEHAAAKVARLVIGRIECRHVFIFQRGFAVPLFPRQNARKGAMGFRP